MKLNISTQNRPLLVRPASQRGMITFPAILVFGVIVTLLVAVTASRAVFMARGTHACSWSSKPIGWPAAPWNAPSWN